jgi:N-acyl-D-aspartate/D-glutamate deacylase
MLDRLIRGGRIVDGGGGPPFTGDVGVADGRIAAIGAHLDGPARETLDAHGLLVTPGFLDIHTHYDAQVLWDPCLEPSSSHGVTTVVIGNCGVGLAPARPDAREALIRLLEGVEDIPAATLRAGIDWSWESFPQLLDALAARPRALDVAALVTHSALRIDVLGAERAGAERATPDEVRRMAALTHEALDAGALGVSTSRNALHRDSTGRLAPSCFAAPDELAALADALRESGRGLLELSYRGSAGDDPAAAASELEWMRHTSARSGRPLTFGSAQLEAAPEQWRALYRGAQEAVRAGAQLWPQTLGRSHAVLVGLPTVHPFAHRPSYGALAPLPPAQRAERLRDPALRARILAEPAQPAPSSDPFAAVLGFALDRVFPLGDPPCYEPAPADSVAARAARAGRDALGLLYDLMLEREGAALLLYMSANYCAGDLEVVREMLEHPRSILGVGDAGAHCGMLCDAGVPTFMLAHWVRDRTRGPRLPVEGVVRKLTAEPAALFGLADRGRLAPGLRADLNLIDPQAVQLEVPRLVHDLPAGGRRLVQAARGYVATLVAGEVVRERGCDTGARPGRLARGRR